MNNLSVIPESTVNSKRTTLTGHFRAAGVLLKSVADSTLVGMLANAVSSKVKEGSKQGRKVFNKAPRLDNALTGALKWGFVIGVGIAGTIIALKIAENYDNMDKAFNAAYNITCCP